MAALIYAIFESEEIQEMIFNKLQDIGFLLRKMDGQLEVIRKKQEQKKLFINIQFFSSIQQTDYIFFERVVNQLNNLIKELGKSGKTKLAEAFEYVIRKAVEKKELISKNGEFYTPKEVVKTVIKLADIKDEMAIYNPVSNMGEFIVEGAKNEKVYIFGQESDTRNFNICTTNLWLHNIIDKRMTQEEEELQLVDLAVANPPFVENSKKRVERLLFRV